MPLIIFLVVVVFILSACMRSIVAIVAVICSAIFLALGAYGYYESKKPEREKREAELKADIEEKKKSWSKDPKKPWEE